MIRLAALALTALLSMGAISQVITGGSTGGSGTAFDGGLTVTRGVEPFTNAQSQDFNDTGFSSRIEGPTDTTVHTSAPIGSFSGCLWYEPDTVMARFQGPVGSASSFALSNGYGVYRGTSDTVVEFYVGAFGSSFSADFTPTDVWGAASGWHHLCYAHNAANRQYTVWHNAVQMQSGTDASPASRPLGTANSYGNIGTGGTSGAHFEGKVDEPAYWLGIVITQANVTALYNAGSPVDPSSIVADPEWFLRMGDDPSDDDTPTTGQVTDQTTNANDFTVIGTESLFVTDTP